MAAGAGTIFRNYLVEVGGQRGQTADRQIDCLADLGTALGNEREALWAMRYGYALCSRAGLETINRRLAAATPEELDSWRQLLRIGLQWNVEVTEPAAPAQVVTQAYCSALPVAYSGLPKHLWGRFATLVLQAAYEATLLAAVLNTREGGSPIVLLTRLGGGAFGNELDWIHSAIQYATERLRGYALDVRIVSHGPVPADLRELAAGLNR
jgi:hypothetical protein